MTAPGWLDALHADIMFAVRSLRRMPGFTAAIVLTLALGIGASTAMFSAIYALLLRPLPFPDPDRLMEVSLTRPAEARWPADDDVAWSYPKFLLLRHAQHVFAELGLYSGGVVTVSGDRETAERVPSEAVGGRYFEMLHIQPILGRVFLPEELERVGAPAAAVIGESFWQERYGANPKALGRTLDINGKPYTIVGVMPSGFAGLSGHATVWTPIATGDTSAFTSPWWLGFRIIGRLAPGITVSRAQAEVRTLGAAIDLATPYHGGHEHWGAAARPLDTTRVDPTIRESLLVLAGAVALVLLITCANIANLLLVRAAQREREIAVRFAIGANRRRLIRQLLTDSLCLALLGGLVAIGVAGAGVHVLDRLNPVTSLRTLHRLSGLGVVNFSQIRVNRPVLLFAAALTVITGILFGLVPALQATRQPLVAGLKAERGQAAIWRTRSISGRSVLSVAEVSMAIVLLAGSGLMLRSLRHLIAVNPGFDASHLLTLRANLPVATSFGEVPDSLAQRGVIYYDRLLPRLAALPGIAGVAITACPPLGGGCNISSADFADRPPTPGV